MDTKLSSRGRCYLDVQVRHLQVTGDLLLWVLTLFPPFLTRDGRLVGITATVSLLSWLVGSWLRWLISTCESKLNTNCWMLWRDRDTQATLSVLQTSQLHTLTYSSSFFFSQLSKKKKYSINRKSTKKNSKKCNFKNWTCDFLRYSF